MDLVVCTGNRIWESLRHDTLFDHTHPRWPSAATRETPRRFGRLHVINEPQF